MRIHIFCIARPYIFLSVCHFSFCSNLCILYLWYFFYALPPDFLWFARKPAGKLNGADPNGSSAISGVVVVVLAGGVCVLVTVQEDEGVLIGLTPVIPLWVKWKKVKMSKMTNENVNFDGYATFWWELIGNWFGVHVLLWLPRCRIASNSASNIWSSVIWLNGVGSSNGFHLATSLRMVRTLVVGPPPDVLFSSVCDSDGASVVGRVIVVLTGGRECCVIITLCSDENDPPIGCVGDVGELTAPAFRFFCETSYGARNCEVSDANVLDFTTNV